MVCFIQFLLVILCVLSFTFSNFTSFEVLLPLLIQVNPNSRTISFNLLSGLLSIAYNFFEIILFNLEVFLVNYLITYSQSLVSSIWIHSW